MRQERMTLNNILTETPADNKRFVVMRGVSSQKVLREFESVSHVRTFVNPAYTKRQNVNRH
jgi:hypothetical protein